MKESRHEHRQLHTLELPHKASLADAGAAGLASNSQKASGSLGPKTLLCGYRCNCRCQNPSYPPYCTTIVDVKTLLSAHSYPRYCATDGRMSKRIESHSPRCQDTPIAPTRVILSRPRLPSVPQNPDCTEQVVARKNSNMQSELELLDR